MYVLVAEWAWPSVLATRRILLHIDNISICIKVLVTTYVYSSKILFWFHLKLAIPDVWDWERCSLCASKAKPWGNWCLKFGILVPWKTDLLAQPTRRIAPRSDAVGWGIGFLTARSFSVFFFLFVLIRAISTNNNAHKI